VTVYQYTAPSLAKRCGSTAATRLATLDDRGAYHRVIATGPEAGPLFADIDRCAKRAYQEQKAMIKNVGKTDRNIRLAVGGILIFLGIAKMGAWITLLGLIVLATGATGTCLAYIPMKINTVKEGDE
jgi:CHASE2 domain-containing sensor protein